MEWTDERHQEAVELISRMVRCPDLAAVALVLTWRAARRYPDEPLGSHVWYSVLQARQGRDLPGIGATRRRDALRHSTQGAGMDDMTDPHPGPEQQAQAREAWELLDEVTTDRQKELCREFTEDFNVKGYTVAQHLGVSPGRVTQMRQEVMDKLLDRLG